MITEEDYKALKLENNLDNLNKDIELVNEELEQIKKLLFVQDTYNEEEEDNDSFGNLSAREEKLHKIVT